MDDAATIVVVAYPATDATDFAATLDTAAYRRYLRETRNGPVNVGDEWDEVVNDGCGDLRPVTLRVVAVEGGEAIDESTTVEFRRAEQA